MTNLGISDSPVENSDNEFLGLGKYAIALAEFTRDCQTPMTIALQGDWGSGKTSLMNLIKAELQDKYTIVWFNTWQYSQFGMQNELSLNLISCFMDKLGTAQNDKEIVNRLKQGLSLAGSAALGFMSGLGGVVGGAALAASKVADALTEPNNNNGYDASKDIAALKEKLQEQVNAALAKGDSNSRIVVFIDDLDRLEPAKAVELLESFKLFLDLRGCVFILACDYQVVSLGLKAKLGADIHELKGKSFFDKIIQLPFKMPVTQYDVDKYISNLLSTININATEAEIDLYSELIEHSIGFNPRNLKRVFNCLLLLTLVAQKADVFIETGSKTGADISTMQRILFACICMQSAYEPLYNHISRNLSEELLQSLKKAETYDNADLKRAFEGTAYDVQQLVNFMEFFCEVASNGAKDLSLLRALLAFSSVTTTASDAPQAREIGFDMELRRSNNRITKHLASYLPKTCLEFFDKTKAKTSTWQPRGSMMSLLSIAICSEQKPFGVMHLWQTPQSDHKKTFYIVLVGAKDRDKINDILNAQFANYADIKQNQLFEYNNNMYNNNTDGLKIYHEVLPDDMPEVERQKRIEFVAMAILNALVKI
ncbi:MAG: KAP family NTPase [Deferribacteraceae bacterium]|jgi:hypothetical protein|nr:KAP family NTPase [Deferribacteraceae bacterium]